MSLNPIINLSESDWEEFNRTFPKAHRWIKRHELRNRRNNTMAALRGLDGLALHRALSAAEQNEREFLRGQLLQIADEINNLKGEEVG